MSVPEIAFVVEADDDAGARREAERRMVALRRYAGLPARRAEARSVLLRPHPPANG